MVCRLPDGKIAITYIGPRGLRVPVAVWRIQELKTRISTHHSWYSLLYALERSDILKNLMLQTMHSRTYLILWGCVFGLRPTFSFQIGHFWFWDSEIGAPPPLWIRHCYASIMQAIYVVANCNFGSKLCQRLIRYMPASKSILMTNKFDFQKNLRVYEQ